MRQALAPISAAVCIPVAALAAFGLGAEWEWAAAGAALACLYATIEALVTVFASRLPVQQAAVVGVGGVVLRMAVVLGALFAIGLGTTREQTLAAIIAFVAVFTVALTARLALVATGHGHVSSPTLPKPAADRPQAGRPGRVQR